MTQKEKAKYLVDKYYNMDLLEFGLRIQAKQCALIAADEILSVLKTERQNIEYIISRQYWQEVKQEIEKL